MRKIYLVILLCLSASLGFAQIGGPDTVCKGANITYIDSSVANSYAWVLDTASNAPAGTNGTTVLDMKSYGLPMGVAVAVDNSTGTYYALVAMRLGQIIRLEFANGPYAPPTNTANLGRLGVLGDSTNGIDVVYDGTNWYAFVTCDNKLVRLDFGNALSNTPTATAMNIANFEYPYQVTIKKYGNEWVGFVANRGGMSAGNNITRLDFGSTLTSTPATVNFGTSFQVSRPTGFSLYQEGGNWFMIVTNIGSGGGPGGNGSITRFEFGNNLKNNAPTGSNLGSYSGKLAGPRGFVMIAGCNKIYGLAANDNGKLAMVDFKNSITTLQGQINVTDLGRFGLSNDVQMQNMYAFWYTDRLSLMACSIGDSVLYMYDRIYQMPTNSQVSYTQATFNKTLANGGSYNITLHADQGSARGPQAFCDKTYVIGTINVALIQNKDTLIASGTTCDLYVWKLNGVVIPGVNTQTYVTTQQGIYTVTGSKANCSATSSYFFVPSSVANTPYNSALRVYPNPSSDVFNIEIQGMNTDKKFNVSCYNAIGAVVATQSIETNQGNGKVKIDLTGLPKGVYQIKVQAEGENNMLRQVVLE
jgi:hypothetical protein